MKGLAFLLGCMALFLMLYFSRFPDFPQLQSGDYVQHVRIASDYARRLPNLAPMSQLVLYGGVEYYLAAFLLLLKSLPAIAAVRYGMGVMLLLSVPVFWKASASISDPSRFASTAIYVLPGFLWFGMIFNSGLYANFLGIVAILLLMAATVGFVSKGVGVRSLFFLIASLGLALFSHYSVLLVFPSLLLTLGYLVVKRRDLRKPAAIALGVLASPVLGLLAFPGILNALLAFASPSSGGNPPTLTPLSSIIPLPSLAYMVAEIDPPAPFRTDLASVGIFILLLAFAHLAYTKRDWKLSMLGLFFLTVLAAGNWGSAWRFAYVGLLPATMMAGIGLRHIFRLLTQRFRLKARPPFFSGFFSSRKQFAGFFLAAFVLTPVVFGASWGASAFALSASSDTHAYSSTDGYLLQAVSWMSAHDADCGYYRALFLQDGNRVPQAEVQTWVPKTCGFVTPTDWRLTYSSLLGGPDVPLITPALTTPEFIESAAAQAGASYIVTTELQTVSLQYCSNPAGQIITLQVENSTAGNSLQLIVAKYPKDNSTLQLHVDGRPYGSFRLFSGNASVVVQLPQGQHDIRAWYGFSGSNVVSVDMGTDNPPVDQGQHSYCDPWWLYSDDWGQGAFVAYSNPDVRIWCVSALCQPQNSP